VEVLNKSKSTNPCHFWGIFGILSGGKGSPNGKYGKVIYSTFCILIKSEKFGLLKFSQKCTVWKIASLAKNSKSEKKMDEKGQCCHFHITAVFY
jgi:hypothetical protein